MKADLGPVDLAVVGSSLLILMHAINEARNGHRVAVFDGADQFGGLWKLHKLKDGTEIESACHLIEHFPAVYEILEKYTGTQFEPLSPQPQKIHQKLRFSRYASRKALVLTFVAALVRMSQMWVRGGLKRGHKSQQEAFDSSLIKCIDFVRFLKTLLIKGPCVEAPVEGYGRFIVNLLKHAEVCGVRCINADIESIAKTETGWVLNLHDSVPVHARKVACSASATSSPWGQDQFIRTGSELLTGFHLVVEVLQKKIVNQLSYWVFANHPHILRVSRVDQVAPRESGGLYLVQLRGREYPDTEEIMPAIRKAMVGLGFVNVPEDIRLVDIIQHRYQSYSTTSQLPDGEIREGFRVLSSAGNLASGVANWNKGRRRMSW